MAGRYQLCPGAVRRSLVGLRFNGAALLFRILRRGHLHPLKATGESGGLVDFNDASR